MLTDSQMMKKASSATPPLPSVRGWRRFIIRAGKVADLARLPVVACVLLIKNNSLRTPYRRLLKNMAWDLDRPEQAYNFSIVVPEKIYRSAQPDDRFIRYLVRAYGIRRIISLNGMMPCSQETRRELGLSVTTFSWGSGPHPPEAELRQVLALMDLGGPVLVHCAGGRTRTGFAVAGYRTFCQGWPEQQAFAEMNNYVHTPQHQTGL